MRKNTHLINIYVKIHNKENLTMDDLRYLAQYDPECFEKTCHNVVYNLPETKPVMEQVLLLPALLPHQPSPSAQAPCEKPDLRRILEHLKQLEQSDSPFINIDSTKVKNLLGSLYMELLFPHNDKEAFFPAPDSNIPPTFDTRA